MSIRTCRTFTTVIYTRAISRREKGISKLNAIIPASPADLMTPVAPERFDALVTQVELTLTDATAGIYRHTYHSWRSWAEAHTINPLRLRPGDVAAFLSEGNTTKATRQRQLSALRRLAKMIYLLDPTDDAQRLLVALGLVKAPSLGVSTHERQRRALTPSQAHTVLQAWSGGDDKHRAIHARNKALVALLLLTGVRRAEAAALRWVDIDFENGVLTVRHGKGDKARQVPIAGDAATDALRLWRDYVDGREFVFCSVKRGGHLGPDAPITGIDVYRIVIATGKLAGVDWKPHDGRRTFITEALATGAPLATVQAAAGHAQGSTTLKYAQAVDAAAAKKMLKLRYG